MPPNLHKWCHSVRPLLISPFRMDQVPRIRLLVSKVRKEPLSFSCNHCPFVVHIAEELSCWDTTTLEKGSASWGSVERRGELPDDGPDKLVETAKAWGLSFPYLYDETQQEAKAYGAECTPDFFVFDANHALVYRGQLDASRPDSGTKADGADLRAALDALIDGRPVPPEQVPSIGCGIKWKA